MLDMTGGLTKTDCQVQFLENSRLSQASKLCKSSYPALCHFCLLITVPLFSASQVVESFHLPETDCISLFKYAFFVILLPVMSQAMICVEQSQQKDLLNTFLCRSKFLLSFVLWPPTFFLSSVASSLCNFTHMESRLCILKAKTLLVYLPLGKW